MGAMDERPPDEASTGWRGLVARTQEQARLQAGWATKRFDELRQRSDVVDTALRVYERDRESAGTLLGSALSMRLFLFFLPLMLFTVGVAGLVGRLIGVDSVSSGAGLTGVVARQIDAAFEQGTTTPWVAVGTGLIGIAYTGRSLAKALVVSSGLCWNLGGLHRATTRVVGIVVGIVVGLALMSALLNRVRAAAGLAVASLSFAAVAVIYLVLWILLFLALPRKTTDPGAALPGAALVALVLTGMQAITQLYIPNELSESSAVYGAVGVAATILGWFFIIGRSLAFAFAVNAVIFERVGSVSQFVFSLPVIRIVPRRSPAVARYFDLDRSEPTPAAPERDQQE